MRYFSILTALILTAGSFCLITAEEMTTSKEVAAAKELYERGHTEQARSIIGVLKTDKNSLLAQQAWYLDFDLFDDLFIPVTFTTTPETFVVSHYLSSKLQDLEVFKKNFKNSKFAPAIEKKLSEDAEQFNSKMNIYKSYYNFDLSDSCSIEFKSDSTFTAVFEKTLSAEPEQTLKISYAGKLEKYEPWGDMKDEWGSTGLILDTDGTIIIELDGKTIREIDRPASIKQYPEYVLRRVTEYGFTQNKTFIREDNTEQLSSMAMLLNDNIAIGYLNLRILFGKMNELVPYQRGPSGEDFRKNFKSKAYFDLMVYKK
ncbi:MAG: hypothetical protein JXN63_00690 [Candidatus Delongbacteria bacterium]|nr:hypothetical protein [Candidatus Delongbacteria bacterium]